VSKARLQTFDIKQPVWYASLNWDLLLSIAEGQKVQFSDISKFPSVERDLALVVNKGVSWQQMAEAAAAAKVPQLQDVQLFDVFESDKLGEGKKSMALSFLFQDPDKTMTDAEIDKAVQRIADQLQQELNAEVRK
jgi:phenylalanyl-tRNA synthetase beta chain